MTRRCLFLNHESEIARAEIRQNGKNGVERRIGHAEPFREGSVKLTVAVPLISAASRKLALVLIVAEAGETRILNASPLAAKGSKIFSKTANNRPRL